MELVYIEWEDASALDTHVGWIHAKDAPSATATIFRQVGFVIDCDPDAIVLTEAYHVDSADGSLVHAPRTRIPMGMVRRMVPINIKATKGVL